MARQSQSTLIWAVSIAVLVAACVYWAIARLSGLEGFCLGFALSSLTLASLQLIVNSLVPTDKRLPQASQMTAVVVLAKLPLVALFLYLATRLDVVGVYCFLATIGLVYSAFVWHLARRGA